MEKRAFLFDLDGVIFDTEGQYTVLWNRIGADWLGDADFGKKMKGQTLVQIFGRYFPDNEAARKDIQERLDRFEGEMNMCREWRIFCGLLPATTFRGR